MDPEERKQQRTVLEQPVWEQFWNWLDTLHPTGGSKLGKAVIYAQNHHETLMNYLLDGRCEISNNRADVQHRRNGKSKQSEYFSISLYGTSVYAGLLEFVRRYRAVDAME